jgi:hypothetical protein
MLQARSTTFKQLVRGRGADAGKFGSSFDHLFDHGSGTGWNDDGGGGVRASRRGTPQSRRPDEAP